MEEEISDIVSPLDEKEEESDEQKEEEWISYPCLPSNESNSLTHTLFDCPPCSPKEIVKHPFLIKMILLYMIIQYLIQPMRCMIMRSCA